MPADHLKYRLLYDVLGALCAVVLLTWSSQVVQADTAEGVEFFEKKIRPLFADHCLKCHGPRKQWSSLRLDSRAAALKGGDNGPALVAGQPDDSELVRRIASTDDDRMPPPEEGKPLKPEQIAAIKEWIKLGAPWPESAVAHDDAREKLWREHWAFQPLKPVEPPEVPPQSQINTPVDQFIIHRLKGAGLQLAPEADQRTLIRRATYDLTGLPPTLEEITEFVDDAAPDAYERLIERLLASPRYGEQWGRYWLDIARFSDTKGYVYARENRFFVNSSLYRDWVIDAFNKDVPYDRFIKLQFAADEVAPDDRAQLAATGFLTLGRRLLGVTPDIIEDRIDMVGRGLLGLTVGCARCHDHKFDPIPTADYYSLYGVFANCIDRQVPLPRPEGAANLKALESELKKLERTAEEIWARRGAETSERVRVRIADYLKAQRHLEDYPDLGVLPTPAPEEIHPAWVRRWEAYLKAAEKRNDPIFIPWNAYIKLAVDQFASQAAEVNRQLAAEAARINPRIAEAFATPPTSADDVAERYAKVFDAVKQAWEQAVADAKAANQPPPTALPNPADEALRQVLYGHNSPCTMPEEPIVATEYLWDGKTIEEVCKVQAQVDAFLEKHRRELPCAVVPTDRNPEDIVEPVIFRRGNPMNKGEAVPRQFLAVAAGPNRKPFQHGSGRLELAEAIADPKNPLTARVWVNRVWQQHFGQGLVTTPSDFGVRSTPPSHPELLDWLASEFIEHGWSTKWLHRTIMLSATYRQSSEPPRDPQTLAIVEQIDPENRLLWRMNPRRLTFEQFRDTLIALSGELDERMGGKGVDVLSARRSVYLLIDRQYLPNVFNVFDFASPDFHSAQRSETTIPQQALFALNSTFLADRARKIADKVSTIASTPEGQTTGAYRAILKRDPTPAEVQRTKQFLAVAAASVDTQSANETKAWSYGYGAIDPQSGITKSFHPLPYFTGESWQGGTLWPDSVLGWIKLTAKGGHVGNDHKHAAIRRWTAGSAGTISIKSEINHQAASGEGVRCWIVASRGGVLKSADIFNGRKRLDVDSLAIEPGDTVDFVVDYGQSLDSDDFVWAPIITQTSPAADAAANPITTTWNSENNFPRVELTPLEQLTQILLVSNELMFVD